DAAVVAEVAIEVGRPFPDAQSREMLRLQRRHLPLIHGVVGDTADAHLAVGPRLGAGPFDALREIVRLARRPVLHVAGRTAAAARVDTHYRIALRRPFLRVADLPTLVAVGGAGNDIRMLVHHALPRGLVAVLEVQPLAVRSVAEDDRIAALLDGAENIGAQHQ